MTRPTPAAECTQPSEVVEREGLATPTSHVDVAQRPAMRVNVAIAREVSHHRLSKQVHGVVFRH